MKTIIGIDLGTTYSLVSVLKDGKPVVLPNALGEFLTPSAVSVRDDGEILVGAPAFARSVTAPEMTVLAFKRDMGTERTITLGKQTFTPVQLSALVLQSLKADAEAALGHPVLEAVITVPAYFGDRQRQATRDAGALAGLKVERIINEPTAAALAYGLQNKHVEQKVVVLDLGGGTFDVTVLEIIEGVIEVQASAGDARLGGEDFDDVLCALLNPRLRGIEWEKDREATALLRDSVRRGRHLLSRLSEVKILLPPLSRDGLLLQLETQLTRAECETAWQPLLERIQGAIERALRDAKLKPAALEHVLLVGGATRMPCIPALATKIFGKQPLQTLPPDEAIALGAAVQAALKAGDRAVEDVLVTDVAPFTLGVSTVMPMGNDYITDVFVPLIERGTTIPCSRVKAFLPAERGQTSVRVAVFQGEHADCKRNEAIGTYLVEDLPPVGDNTLEFRFTYDLNGLLEVEVTRLATKKSESFFVQNRQKSLSGDELETAREAMKKWKVHPRELLPNTTAIERGEAMYTTLRGTEREEFGHLLLQFRAIVERQAPVEIARARASLLEVIRRIRER